MITTNLSVMNDASEYIKYKLSAISNLCSLWTDLYDILDEQYLNRTPIDFLNSYRLENSMNLLRDTNLSITEIAYSCGFNNLSYYSETFKKYKGCTPNEYREKSFENTL